MSTFRLKCCLVLKMDMFMWSHFLVFMPGRTGVDRLGKGILCIVVSVSWPWQGHQLHRCMLERSCSDFRFLGTFSGSTIVGRVIILVILTARLGSGGGCVLACRSSYHVFRVLFWWFGMRGMTYSNTLIGPELYCAVLVANLGAERL